MSVGMPKIRSGIALASEIVQAADTENDGDGRTSRAELNRILSNEGYGKGDPMRRGTMALFAQARKLAGGKAPTLADIQKAAKRDTRAVAQAAARDARTHQLSDRELATLGRPQKAAVRFAAQFGGHTLDEFFF